MIERIMDWVVPRGLVVAPNWRDKLRISHDHITAEIWRLEIVQDELRELQREQQVAAVRRKDNIDDMQRWIDGIKDARG